QATSNSMAARPSMKINDIFLTMVSSLRTVFLLLDSRVILAQPFYIVKRWVDSGGLRGVAKTRAKKHHHGPLLDDKNKKFAEIKTKVNLRALLGQLCGL
ncbi:MAG: hypothetical protein NTW99_14005, partial [Chloroflexi bacterium]|nr:hypothetical protein [Chloroflexota bacterium]